MSSVETNTKRLSYYKCCDHCGNNFPEAGQSICDTEPDKHTVPCNESDLITGDSFCKEGSRVAN